MFRRTEQLNPNYKEIGRLLEMLSETDIPHSYHKIFDGWQIGYPCLYAEGDCICSVIEHFGSYGHHVDLLEIRGLLTEEEKLTNYGTLGYLTAEEVFERIKSHWEANKGET